MDKEQLEELAMTGEWSESITKQLTPNQLNKLQYGLGHKKTNLLGLSAQFKTLDKLPKDLFHPDGLKVSNGVGESVIHHAAMHNQLCHIPRELLNEENLNSPNSEGTTPIHYTCLHLCLNQVPPELVSRKSLIKPNHHGLNALDFSLYAYFDIWEKDRDISPEDLKENELQVNEQIKIILSKLTDKDIKDYYKITKEKPASPLNNKKTYILKRETEKRKLLRGLEKTEDDIEV